MASRNFDGFVEILDRVIVDKRVTYVAVGLVVGGAAAGISRGGPEDWSFDGVVPWGGVDVCRLSRRIA